MNNNLEKYSIEKAIFSDDTRRCRRSGGQGVTL